MSVNRFIYHYCAIWQLDGGGTSCTDGIMLLDNRITNMSEHQRLKPLINSQEYHRMTITSLSFIGMELEAGSGNKMSERPFLKLHIDDWNSDIHGLNRRQQEILFFMASRMDDENVVSYSCEEKREFIKSKGMSNSTFNTTVAPLIKAGLISKEGRKKFVVNKKYIAIGSR